jgi:ESS family glutamate:Na+ symporter
VGGLVTLLILIPFFGDPPIIASLLEISFEGGHGTVAGLTPVFADLGFNDGQAMANGLATLSLISALVIGVILINWGHRHGHAEKEQPIIHRHKRQFYHYTLIHQVHIKYKEMHDRHLTAAKVLRQVFLVALSVGIGFAIRAILITIEDLTWGQAGVKIFGYIPSFSICLFGGLIVNHVCQKLGIHVSMTANSLISTLALGILIMTAVGTMSLEFFRQANLATSFWILFAAGTIWILSAVLILARRMFMRHWFHNAMISFGQAMGMTATGLLFAQMVDPKNRTGAVEAFGYKQMLFEPLMGGGLVTAMSMPLILLLGLPLFTIICGVIAIAWFLAGRLYFLKQSID